METENHFLKKFGVSDQEGEGPIKGNGSFLVQVLGSPEHRKVSELFPTVQILCPEPKLLATAAVALNPTGRAPV